METYLNSARHEFKYYKSLGDKTFQQLDEDRLFLAPNSESNSIAIIVKHLWGNMLSRWTDFLTSDGEKAWRKRDEEFEADFRTKEELIRKWEEGWHCLFNALDSITPEHYGAVIVIRNMEHSLEEAINRQIAHYAYHVGQIVFLGKMIQGKDWNTLSIPKGHSQQFNAKKFSSPRRREHFSTDFESQDDAGE
jgi:hypothetical protein